MPRMINDPHLGILNLVGQPAGLSTDLAALTPMFNRVTQSETAPPKCDVLLVYCVIQADGTIANTQRLLRQVIQESGASVVVVASEHDVEEYIKAAPVGRLGRTNLIMTLRRNTTFSEFLANLFAVMQRGVPLPEAWPQACSSFGQLTRQAVPETIYSNEIPHFGFKPCG